MSEPSLRDTIADAICRSDDMGALDKLPAHWPEHEDYRRMADAALRALHTQRDAIATAIRHNRPLTREQAEAAADAVLATLGAGTVQPRPFTQEDRDEVDAAVEQIRRREMEERWRH